MPASSRLPLSFFEFAAVQIDAVFRVNPVAMLLEQPIDAVEVAAFFIGGEREDQIAVRATDPSFFRRMKFVDQDGVAVLHVLGAAAVEVAVLFDEFEWIGGPVLAESFDDIQVAEEQDGFALARFREGARRDSSCARWGRRR